MAARLLPAALVLGALAADAAGLHGLASYLLLTGVPAAAWAALTLLGRLLDLPARTKGEAYVRFETSLASLGLVLVLVAAAARAQGAEAGEVPRLTASAVAAALVIYLLQAGTSLVAPRPRLPRRSVAPAADARA